MGEKKKTADAGHKALYRKYRSKSLNEVVGQEHITKTLENALKQDKLSHAYLFTGPRGTGKTSIARILAHEINNLPYEDETTHLDIIEIDAASNRRIDDIRDLRDKVHIAPVSAKYKVYIIDEVHMLTTESFNALLKTLEEPPAHVIFILATTEVHKLPATIISRTQRHGFRLIPIQKVIGHLKHIADQEGIQIDEASLSLLAEHGGGSFRDSISLLDQISSSPDPITSELIELLLGLAPQNTLQGLIEAALSGNGVEVMSKLETLIEVGLTASAVATQILHKLRNDIKSGENSDILVRLMSDLLTVQPAQYPQLRLETILLSVAPPVLKISSSTRTIAASTPAAEKRIEKKSQANTEKQPPDSDQTAPDSKAEPVKSKITDRPKTQPTESKTPEAFSLEEHWPKVLALTKQKNNPLFTVLKLATPELEGSDLVLIFEFGFHQKKIEEAKYKAMISQFIQEVTGNNVTIRTIVDKSRVRSIGSTSVTQTAIDPASASLISSVQDIMGGGEVVNV